MKCKLCEKKGVTFCCLEREWSEPKPKFAWGEKETVAECCLCPDHNWRAADINMGIRRSLLDFRIKVNKKLDSFPESLSVKFITMLIPDDGGETGSTTIHRIPKGGHIEVNHMGVAAEELAKLAGDSASLEHTK